MTNVETQTGLDRKITVESDAFYRYLIVEDQSFSNRKISSSLTKAEAIKIGVALIESTGKTLEEVAKEEAEKKAKEAHAKLGKRRDELAREHTGNPCTVYGYCSELSRKLIDRIIELEEQNSVKATKHTAL